MKVTIKEENKKKPQLIESDFNNGDGLLWHYSPEVSYVYIVFESTKLLTHFGGVCGHSLKRMLNEFGDQCERVDLELIVTRKT